MASQKRAILIMVVLALVAIVLTIASSGALSGFSSFQTVQTGGSLTQLQTSVNVGVYADSPCTQNATFVDWGALSLGDSTTRTVWVKNLGNAVVELSLTTTNWTPTAASQAIALSWNREGRSIAPNEVIQATFTLTVSENVDPSITAFSFNIRITGTA